MGIRGTGLRRSIDSAARVGVSVYPSSHNGMRGGRQLLTPSQPSAVRGEMATRFRVFDWGSTPAALEVLDMSTPLRSANGGYGETSLRILLVEDHDGIARACQRLMASRGHFVIRAASVASALATVERESFDLFICDLSLPDGSGLDLLPRLRACCMPLRSGTAVPAIAISGSVCEDDVAQCLAVGFAAHVAKPFDADRLFAVIAQITAQPVGNEGIPSPAPARLR
jgi:CheY-like chemotaxis protein